MTQGDVLSGKAVIGQSGGPTAVINQSLVGAIEEARRHPAITGFYGAVHGVQGVLQEDLIDLFAETPETLERVARTPSASLGSVRKKPSADECRELFEILQSHEVRYFFYIGGNDSAETASIVARLAAGSGYDLRVFHIPKTIDNDLLVNDHCPGYGSAARFVALALMGDNLDNRSLKGVKIDVIMGRHAGFLTAASALARRREDDGPHLIYVPEAPFDLDSFTASVEATFSLHGRCLIAVSEGISGPDGKPIFQTGEKDSHGNVQLSGTGALGDYLAGVVKERLRISRVRADTFGYLQRCFPGVVSEVDATEAREVGAFAVRAAASGEHESGSVAIRRLESAPYRSEYFITPLVTVARNTRSLGSDFLADNGHDVTRKFLDYARPLVGDLPETGRLRGLPIPRRSKGQRSA